jgi:signal transduction histidine kinase
MEKRKNFYLIYKEAINNAYKYSEGKNVNVSIAEKDHNLIMIITDNGKGFDMASKSVNGNGLGNMRTRAEEMHAKLDITSWPGKGTRVCLQMKV